MTFEKVEDILEFAIQKERDAQQFYLDASRKERMKGVREMLVEFAEQEKKHEQMLTGFKEKGVVEGLEGYDFKWIKDIKRSDFVVDMEYKKGMSYSEILMLAAKNEEKALALYNKMLKEVNTPEGQNLFKMLCQEEAKHKLALESKYDDYMAEMGD
jgi:rubrerythrin